MSLKSRLVKPPSLLSLPSCQEYSALTGEEPASRSLLSNPHLFHVVQQTDSDLQSMPYAQKGGTQLVVNT